MDNEERTKCLDKKERMLRFLNSLYIPVGKRAEATSLIESIANHKLRDIEDEDAHDVGLKLLMILTTGKGKYETYQGWTIKRADIDNVGKTYASAYIYAPGERGRPQRIVKNSNKIAVIY